MKHHTTTTMLAVFMLSTGCGNTDREDSDGFGKIEQALYAEDIDDKEDSQGVIRITVGADASVIVTKVGGEADTANYFSADSGEVVLYATTGLIFKKKVELRSIAYEGSDRRTSISFGNLDVISALEEAGLANEGQKLTLHATALPNIPYEDRPEWARGDYEDNWDECEGWLCTHSNKVSLKVAAYGLIYPDDQISARLNSGNCGEGMARNKDNGHLCDKSLYTPGAHNIWFDCPTGNAFQIKTSVSKPSDAAQEPEVSFMMLRPQSFEFESRHDFVAPPSSDDTKAARCLLRMDVDTPSEVKLHIRDVTKAPRKKPEGKIECEACTDQISCQFMIDDLFDDFKSFYTKGGREVGRVTFAVEPNPTNENGEQTGEINYCWRSGYKITCGQGAIDKGYTTNRLMFHEMAHAMDHSKVVGGSSGHCYDHACGSSEFQAALLETYYFPESCSGSGYTFYDKNGVGRKPQDILEPILDLPVKKLWDFSLGSVSVEKFDKYIDKYDGLSDDDTMKDLFVCQGYSNAQKEFCVASFAKEESEEPTQP